MVNQSPICPVHISGDNIRDALQAARSQHPDDFRRQEQAWLRSTLPPLLSATEIMYGLAATDHGVECADAALQGALLGGVVIRSLIESDQVSSETCLRNFNDRLLGERGMIYDGGGGIEDDAVTGVLGHEVVDAIKEISSPAAQCMCSMVLGIALTPKVGPTAH